MRYPCLAVCAALLACAPRGRASEPSLRSIRLPSPSIEDVEPTPEASHVEFGAWRGLGFGTYLAPRVEFLPDDGAVDILFHFHAGQMAEAEWRASGLRAVVVSAAFGNGSGPYNAAFADPARFSRMTNEVLRALGREHQRTFTARRLGIVAFSAGFGAPQKILAVPDLFERVDTLILLDGMHAGYKQERASRSVDMRPLSMFARFAEEATSGRKLMVVTHSAIVPPDFASTRETVAAMLEGLGIAPERAPRTAWRGMRLELEAHRGDLHVRGFGGGGPNDHMDHLHLVGEMVRRYLVPRWRQ